MAFSAAMKNYFGMHPNQTLAQFAGELSKLTYEEKVWFQEALVAIGVDCDPPLKPKAK